jgi:hypothetical protein
VTIGPLDPASLLSVLSRCGVDFVVIGAMAVGVHGEVRSTGNVDIMLPIGDEPNKRALQLALEELGAVRLTAQQGGVAVDPENPYPTLMFSARHGKLDVLYRPDGSDGYANVRRRASRASIGGHPVLIAGRDDLVRMKLAAGRPHDLQDVANLTAVDSAGAGSRRVRASMMLTAGVDAQWATDLAAARAALFDPASTVDAKARSLTIEATRTDLTDAQIELWAQALADRLHGAGVLAGREVSVSIPAIT